MRIYTVACAPCCTHMVLRHTRDRRKSENRDRMLILIVNKDDHLAHLGRHRWWRMKVAAAHCYTSSSSARTSTRTTAASYYDDDLDAAGVAADRKRTGWSSDKAGPSPCSMSRGRSLKVVDGRGVYNRQRDPPSKDPLDDRQRRRRRYHRRRCRRYHYRCRRR